MAKVGIVYGDVHGNVHDEACVAVLRAAHKYLKPHFSINLGDLLDATPFSRHPKQALSEGDRKDWAQTELKFAKDLLDYCQKYTLEQTTFIEGNHDAWVERWCANAGTAGYSIHSLLSVRKHLTQGRERFRYIPFVDEQMRKGSYAVLHPRLVAAHGWSANRHAASAHLQLAMPRSIVFGHTHRQNRTTIRNPYTDELIEAVGIGCLCKLQPIYKHGSPSQWTHGFAVGYFGKKSYQLYPVTIEKGSTVLPCGKELHP